jgi:hypothetical protein
MDNNGLRKMATGILALQIVAVIVSLAVFVYADKITGSLLANSTDTINALQSTKEFASIRLQRMRDEVYDVGGKILSADSGAEKLSSQFLALQHMLDDFKRTIDKSGSDIIAAVDVATTTINSQLSSMSSKDLITPQNYLTRIGSIIILYLAIQVFGRLYKFNINLASDYEAKADALELCIDKFHSGDFSKDFEALINIIKPAAIDIPDVQSPFERWFSGKKGRDPGSAGSTNESHKPAAKSGADQEHPNPH